MKTKLKTNLFLGMFFVLLLLSMRTLDVMTYTGTDDIDDISYIENSVFVNQGNYTPYIDMISIEINGTHAILELQAEANESDLVLYYIWIYWTDVVEVVTETNTDINKDFGANDLDEVNRTLCYFKSSSINHVSTILYNSTNDMVYSTFNINVVSIEDNFIYYPLPAEVVEAYPNPKTVWAKTWSSNHNGVIDPPEILIDYIDFYPNSINTYLPNEVNLGLLGLVALPIAVVIRRKIKKT